MLRYSLLLVRRWRRIAVVTGGNKGIGLEVCRQLAASGVTVVLAARDETRGAAAAEKLREQGVAGVIFHQLEVTDASSIARLAEFLKTRFGRLDILVSSRFPFPTFPSPLRFARLSMPKLLAQRDCSGQQRCHWRDRACRRSVFWSKTRGRTGKIGRSVGIFPCPGPEKKKSH